MLISSHSSCPASTAKSRTLLPYRRTCDTGCEAHTRKSHQALPDQRTGCPEESRTGLLYSHQCAELTPGGLGNILAITARVELVPVRHVTRAVVIVGAPIPKRNVEQTIFRPKEQGAAILVGLGLVYCKNDAHSLVKDFG